MRLRSHAIGDLVMPVRTWTPASEARHRTVTYVDLSAIDQGTKTIAGAKLIVGRDAPSRARQLIAKDDVLVSTVRPNLNAVALVPSELDGATASTGFCILRPDPTQLDPQYLFHWVRSPDFVHEMSRRATGASYPAVTDRIVLKSEIRVPYLTEQRRIARILDCADALRARRRAALAELDTLAKAIFMEMFGDPVKNERRWRRVAFSSVLDRIDSGCSPVCLDRPANDDEWGVLKLGAVTWGKYKASENKALPANTLPDPELEVRPGDVLFVRKNTYELVGACALVTETRRKLMMSDLIFRFRFATDASLEPVYVQQLLMFPTKRRQMQRLAGGTAGSMPNISKGRLSSLAIELPPLDLQREFTVRAAAVNQRLVECSVSATELDALFASLQHRAFSGAL